VSNLTELVASLNKIARGQRDGMNVVGAAMGTAADFSILAGVLGGPIGVAVAVLVSLLVVLSQSATQDLDAIAGAIEEIIGGQRAQNILARLHALDLPVAQASSVMKILPSVLPPNPPLSWDARVSYVNLCIQALENFSQGDQWSTVYVDEVYYSDDRSGPIEPDHAGDAAVVFTTRYILPDFLRALFILISASAALEVPLDPDVLRGYRDNVLVQVYNQATDGIAFVAVPTPEEVYTGDPRDVDSSTGFVISPWSFGRTIWSWNPPGENFPDPDGGYQWHGAVDRYTGCNSVGEYPGVVYANIPSDPDPQFYPQFYAKLALANLKRWKSVYINLGLPYVWNAINRLSDLVGDPPVMKGAHRGQWSLREIHSTLGPVHLPENIDRGIPLSRTFETLAMLRRGAGNYGWPLSLRDQLDALPWPDAGVVPI
jgi:hypothetical protein